MRKKGEVLVKTFYLLENTLYIWSGRIFPLPQTVLSSYGHDCMQKLQLLLLCKFYCKESSRIIYNLNFMSAHQRNSQQ